MVCIACAQTAGGNVLLVGAQGQGAQHFQVFCLLVKGVKGKG